MKVLEYKSYQVSLLAVSCRKPSHRPWWAKRMSDHSSF
jgi:hypothetical protein